MPVYVQMSELAGGKLGDAYVERWVPLPSYDAQQERRLEDWRGPVPAYIVALANAGMLLSLPLVVFWGAWSCRRQHTGRDIAYDRLLAGSLLAPTIRRGKSRKRSN